MLTKGVNMNTERKNKLIKYLYPSTQAVDFMLDDFYIELIKILPKKVVFSKDNLNKDNRQKNLQLANKTVKDFLEGNQLYKNRLLELFLCKDYSSLINDIIIGYVLYLTPHINRGTGADVFADTRSVCYSKPSILDWI